jgi:hypothetical protein
MIPILGYICSFVAAKYVDVELTRNEHIFKRQASIEDAQTGSLFSFQGIVEVGTPPQKMRVMFDTGSFLFWVRDRKCMDKHQNFCSGLASYDKNKSTSYRGPGKAIKQIEYADGAKVNGNKAIEMISVGGLSVKNQDFTQAVSFNHHMSEQDGIMGLGISSPDQIMFFRNLFNQKHIKSPIYSYHLDANDLNGGLTFGAIDTARYDGSLLWVPVAYRAEYVGQHWGLSVYNLKVSNSEIKVSRDVEILLDTGTSLGALIAHWLQTCLSSILLSRRGFWRFLQKSTFTKVEMYVDLPLREEVKMKIPLSSVTL